MKDAEVLNCGQIRFDPKSLQSTWLNQGLGVPPPLPNFLWSFARIPLVALVASGAKTPNPLASLLHVNNSRYIIEWLLGSLKSCAPFETIFICLNVQIKILNDWRKYCKMYRLCGVHISTLTVSLSTEFLWDCRCFICQLWFYSASDNGDKSGLLVPVKEQSLQGWTNEIWMASTMSHLTSIVTWVQGSPKHVISWWMNLHHFQYDVEISATLNHAFEPLSVDLFELAEFRLSV